LRSSFVFAVYEKYAPFFMIACKQVSQTARALHLCVFEQPVYEDFFNTLLDRLGCLHDGHIPCGMQWMQDIAIKIGNIWCGDKGIELSGCWKSFHDTIRHGVKPAEVALSQNGVIPASRSCGHARVAHTHAWHMQQPGYEQPEQAHRPWRCHNNFIRVLLADIPDSVQHRGHAQGASCSERKTKFVDCGQDAVRAVFRASARNDRAINRRASACAAVLLKQIVSAIGFAYGIGEYKRFYGMPVYMLCKFGV
jgi:hypothetical protein